jgi:hypothetical protein
MVGDDLTNSQVINIVEVLQYQTWQGIGQNYL